MLRKTGRAECGSVLVTVLVFTASMLVLGIALLTCSLNERYIADYHQLSARLYYIAEAGIEAGVAVMRRSFNHREGFTGKIGEGTYTVSFVFPESGNTLDLNQRMVVSTGHLDGQSLTLAVILQAEPLYEKGLVVSHKLEIYDCQIYGGLHVNREMHVKKDREGISEVMEGADFTYVEKEQIKFGGQAGLRVKDILYTDRHSIPDAWKTAPLTIPAIDFKRFTREGGALCQTLCGLWPPVPFCYRDGEGAIQVNTDLAIKPTGAPLNYGGTLVVRGNCVIDGPFNFDGRLIVFGNVTVNAGEEAPVNISGLVLAEGFVKINGTPNKGRTGNILMIVAKKQIIFDKAAGGEEMFLGGVVLLFSETSDVSIGSPSGPRFNFYGTIIANSAKLYNCNLHYVPGVFLDCPDLPGYGVVIKEWLRQQP